jgi:thioredoxin-related protein
VQFFQGTWEQLLAEAQRTGKPVFVDMYTDWCGWCKVMDRNTFSNAEVGTYVTQNYLAYKLNAERGEGPALARKYQVSGYPTVVVLKYDGSHLTNLVGYLDAPSFLGKLKESQAKGTRAGGGQGTNNRPPAATLEDYLRQKQLAMNALETQLLAQSTALAAACSTARALGASRDRYGYEDFTDTLRGLEGRDRQLVEAYYLLGRADFPALFAAVETLAQNATTSPDWVHWWAWQFYNAPTPEAGAQPYSALKLVNDLLRKTGPRPDVLDTKAALRARAGQFADATEAARQALDLCRQQGAPQPYTEVLYAVAKAQRSE